MRQLVIITAVLVLSIAFITKSVWRRAQVSKFGYTLTRYDDDQIRISWGTPSGVNISPKSALRFFLGWELELGAAEFPQLTSLDDVWMHDVIPDTLGEATTASYVNPLNKDAFSQMFRMIELAQGGNINSRPMTRIAAQNYAYLGWVVLNDNDAKALVLALADRTQVDLNQDLKTTEGVLFRLAPGVEKRLASNPKGMSRRLLKVAVGLTCKKVNVV